MNRSRASRSRISILAIFAAALLLPGAAFAAQHYMPGHPGDTSSAVSEQVAAPAGTTADTDPDISKTPEALRPVRDKLLAKLDPHDPASVFVVIDAIQANPKLATNCHEVAHDLGHRAYELYGFSGALNFIDAKRLDKPSIQDVCAGGYVHGVLEEAALHDPSFEKDPGALCRTLPASQRASCFHGVGHALMFKNIRYLPDALAGCRKAGDVNDASRCFEGVWMELFWGNNDYVGTGGLGWEFDAPLEPCLQTDRDAKPACFIYSSFGYLRTHKKDYAGAVRLCTQSGLNASDADFCLKGVGITMISNFKSGHLERSEAFVAGLSDSQKHAFYQGVVGYGLLSNLPRAELARACSAMSTDRNVCSQALAGH